MSTDEGATNVDGSPSVPDKKPQPVLVVMSTMTAITAIVGALTLAGAFNEQTMGVIAIVVAGINQGVAYYLRGQVVPLVDVGSYVNAERQVVAGPASTV